jgi:predicted PurR-regulated permease PerM
MNETIAAVIIALLLINLIGLLVVGVHISGQSAYTRQLDSRVTQLEALVKYLPTHQDLASLRAEINKVVETSAAISGQTHAMTQMLRTIQEHLLENDR